MNTANIKNGAVCFTLTNNSVKKAVKSYTMSKRYINTMMRATIINILYHRLNLDEKEFVTKNFNEVPFKTFRSKSNNVMIREFHAYMSACKDAIEKNYLREFYLYFIDASSGDIIENYKFSFDYTKKPDPENKPTGENLIENTSELLRTLEEFGRHRKYNTEIQVKVEFTYFEETPEEYEPPGFRNIDTSESFMNKLQKSGNSVLIGSLFTGFHMMKCRGRGDVFNFDQSSIHSQESVEDENNADELVEAIPAIDKELEATDIERASLHIVDNVLFTEEFTQDENTQITTTNDSPKNKMNETYLSQCIDISSDDEDLEILCYCKLSSINAYILDRIKCSICMRGFHLPCVGYFDKSFLKEPFKCTHCKGGKDVVEILETHMNKTVCSVRYLLGVIYKYGKLPKKIISKSGEAMDKLNKLKLFVMDGNEIVKVNEEVLKALFKCDVKLPDFTKFINVTL